LAKVKEKDEYTFVHSLNVALLSGFLARRLQGNDKSLIEDVVIGGLLHDVGKAKIPLEILNKPGPLTDEEYAVMKQHPVLGLEMLNEAGINEETILSVTSYHHERMDGKGYPCQLRGNFIPFVARIAAVADVFDAVTTSRVYRTAESLYFAVSLIIKETNKHFDPKVARELISALGLYPPGTVVELSDGSTAVVISSNPGDLLRPVVLLLYDSEGNPIAQSHPIDLKEAPNLYIKRVTGNFNK
ncbi:MAG: HD-GYP domain-containing protein, partial [Acetomicrobium flavidum]|uniref:HD-GYP domain-containing protein n=1 Tax=Acetomicrobium flavidum TaxID=49896 RepID=UPI001693B2DD|nr:HD-GYP domain-containing protein [Acetomicrobium flavidum]